MDMIKGAKKVMDKHVRPGEDVLIVTTTNQEASVPNVLALAAQARGANEVVVASIAPRSKQAPDVPKCIIEAAKVADVIFSTSKQSLCYTSLTSIAGKSGGKVRHISMDIIPEMLVSGAIHADYDEVRKTVLKLCRIMERSKKGRVTTDLGTDIKFEIGRKCCEFFGIPHSTGFMPWWASVPDGEAMTAVFEDTAEGKLVVDVSTVSSYEALPSHVLSQPIEMEIKNGTVVNVKGGAEAKELKKVLDESSDRNAWRISEFSIGANPMSEIRARHEDKRRLGTIHFAIGSNNFFGGKIKSKVHVDLVVNKPTIILDKKTIMEKGKLLV